MNYFLLDFFFLINLNLIDIFFYCINAFDPFLQNGFFVFNWNNYCDFPQNLSFFFGIKFCLCIGFLILIRGGTPRYRYDYLTKLGWLKFIGFVILMFITSVFFFFLF